LPELSVHARSIRFRETPVAVRDDGGDGTPDGIGVAVRVGVIVGGTDVGVRVGVAVGGTDVAVRVGVRVAVGSTAVGVGVAVTSPLMMVKLSAIAPVSRRNFASRRFPSTRRRSVLAPVIEVEHLAICVSEKKW
jgi:hypothetical protein